VLKTLERIKSLNIAVIGDIMLDRYIIGKVERISPEAPVPVLFVQEEYHVLGGAGNVAANLSKLEVDNVHLFCRIADDQFGELIKRELNELHNKYRNAEATYFGHDQTTVKTRVMADNHQIVRFDREKLESIPNATADSIVHRIELNLDSFDAILISDYGKGMITWYLLEELEKAIRGKIPICIDPSPKTFYPTMRETIFLPNTKERREIHKLEGTKLENKFKAVVETDGANGIYVYYGANQVPTHIKAIEVSDVVDTVGAGDTVTAVFTAAIATSATIYEAATLANIAASVVVRHAKTYAVSYDEIFNVIEPYCNP